MLAWQTRWTSSSACGGLDSQRLGVLPFEAGTLVTLKIYNGEDGKFHRYEDAWILLEKWEVKALCLTPH